MPAAAVISEKRTNPRTEGTTKTNLSKTTSTGVSNESGKICSKIIENRGGKFDRFTASSLHKAIFKKHVTHGIQKVQKSKLRNKFASPTDRLLSPCSQKLNDHKSKLFVAKSNPTKLNFARKERLAAATEDDDDDDYY